MKEDMSLENAKRLLYIENLLKSLMEKYNYQYIKTPVLEKRELINYFTDEDLDYPLKPNNQIGAIKNYLKVSNKNKLFKYFQFGPVFETFEQHEINQAGIDVIGSKNASVDAEVISMAINFNRLLGLDKFVLKVNTTGDNHHFQLLLEYLEAIEIDYVVDESLFLDANYFNDIVFEIVTDIDELEEQLVIGYGGRYNDLISEIGNEAASGFGYSLNIDNLLKVLNYDGFILADDNGLDVYIKTFDDTMIPYILNLSQTLRMNGFNTEIDHMNNNEVIDSKFTIIVNDEDKKDGLLLIINNRTKEEEKIEEEYIINFLDEKVSGEDEEHVH
ncbi:MAG: ATP phosphoribosyltransferase regulatory subunit [Bacilli bacterium]|nr:ATP phosphoribosyltransferase regulatory subunit [Bacilli bacterium]MDD4547551.1 ATP phosphoribosyltransferase regulatory subunit [Bacilli bacterium]